MPIKIFSKKQADLSSFTSIPKTDVEASEWQKANHDWWQDNPMSYEFDDKGEIKKERYSKDWFIEIDRRFFLDSRHAIGWKDRPFDNIIPYDDLEDLDLLEIGVGCGSHAAILAEHSKNYTGIDLTENAIDTTKKRFKKFGLEGNLIQMDAEKMDFQDDSFDLIWSWGVIHHSSNTNNALSEVARILKPGGKLIAMVYHDSFWNRYIRGALYYGILKGEFFQGNSLPRIIQNNTDGALARYYTIKEWNDTLSNRFDINKTTIIGSKSQLVPLGMGRIKRILMSLIPDKIGRFITNRAFFGFMVVSNATKR